MLEEDKKKLENELKSEQGKLEIPVETIIEQIETFKKGILYVRIVRACTIGDGIRIIPEEHYNKYFDLFQSAVDNERIIKFVPASGAASRMFKKLQSVLTNSKTTHKELEKAANSGDEESSSVLEFINNLKHFAFYEDLVGGAARHDFGVSRHQLHSTAIGGSRNAFDDSIRAAAFVGPNAAMPSAGSKLTMTGVPTAGTASALA